MRPVRSRRSGLSLMYSAVTDLKALIAACNRRAGRLLDGLLTSLLQWCSSPSSSCLLIDSTETPKSRANSLTWAHTQRTPESSRSCSSFCSNPHEDWPESGRDQGPRLTFRTGSERFARFWTSLSTVRDREAPGSNPGPPTIVLLFELTARKCGRRLI